MYASILAAGALGYALNMLFLVVEKPHRALERKMSRRRPRTARCRRRRRRRRPSCPARAGTHITIRGLTKYFAGWPLYENFDLDIPKHKIVSVFGPNGCGKSTLINMIAGPGSDRRGRDPVRRQVAQGHQDRLRVPELPRGDVPVDAHHRQHRLPAASSKARSKAEVDRAHGGAGRVVRRQVRPQPLSRTSCRAASSRRPRSCARWRRTPRCCSSTSRSRRSTSR